MVTIGHSKVSDCFDDPRLVDPVASVGGLLELSNFTESAVLTHNCLNLHVAEQNPAFVTHGTICRYLARDKNSRG